MPDLVAYSAFAALAIPLSVVDFAERRLPHPLMLATYITTGLLVIVNSVLDEDASRALRAAIGMTAACLVYLAIAMAFPGELGAGDVRLAGIIGGVLAWHSWTALPLGLLLGAATGALLGLTVIIAKGDHRRTQIPAGPTMLLGALIALLM